MLTANELQLSEAPCIITLLARVYLEFLRPEVP